MAAHDLGPAEEGQRPARRPKLAKRVYRHLAWGEPAPLQLVRWTLAERFGWTLEYIDGLAVQEMHDLIQIDDGRAKDREQQMRTKKSSGKSGRR
jgi:hypothetical protein